MKPIDNWKERFLNRIICGDSDQLLQEIPDDSINLVVTSPPYFQQRDYDGLGIGNEKNWKNILAIY